ncbi:xanthine dehydrogenase family protein molybdopterin-binding subunit [Natrinema gelatinilyticum]|uniref:xanthine dehydrogenase family protein molybdopterin-binding subunit n=1 Tax=Natrinema gelatinilyticum TaxID=2961571 RepID=UPI0020C30931|nr:xanthine dehydrogenase family protein molybdopterin-binding subunit [Natrinema gelatinilyticum]
MSSELTEPVAETEPESSLEEANAAVGERINSKLGRKLVTGNGKYVDDMELPGTLHARFVRSQHAHAKIEHIDTSEAEAMAGVELVWTAENIDPYVEQFSHPENDFPDEEVLASDRVRYVGDEVAIVLAEDRNTAVEAADKVRVEYERLNAVTTPQEALEEDAPLIHPELDADLDCPVDGNLIYEGATVGGGDIDEAMENADLIVEESFHTSKTNPNALEPHGIIADFNSADHHLTIWASTQVPHRLPELIPTAVKDLEPTDITCKLPDVGGGFGQKIGRYSHDVAVSVLAMVTERPIKMVFDRLEEMKAGRGRYDEYLTGRLGVTEDGEFVGLDVDMLQNSGGYANYAKVVSFSSALTAGGPYLIPSQNIGYRVVYTNVMPGIAVRGFGNPQFMFCLEQLIDMAAAELDMDPIELRLQNMPKLEDQPLRTATRLKFRATDIHECMDRVREMINWDDHRGGYRTRDGKLRGVGLGTVMQRNGNKSAKGADFAGAMVKIDRYGKVKVYTGTANIGQGTETGIGQMVADTLGVDIDRIDLIIGDTDVTPEDMGVWADRSTIFAGTAASRAAEDVKETIVELAAYTLDIPESDVVLRNGRISESGNPDNGMGFEEFCDFATFGDQNERPEHMRDGVSLIGEARFETEEGEFMDHETGTGSVSHVYTFAVQAAVVEIDPQTGEVVVSDVAVSEDAGNVINPKLAEGQVQGGIVQALGEVLLENYEYDSNGNLMNGNLVDYHLPTAADVPMIWSDDISHVETPDPTTSHGQKGLGECSTVTTFPAVANAIADATGIRFTELPYSPDKVLPKLAEEGLREM